jgi:hypothetical protein
MGFDMDVDLPSRSSRSKPHADTIICGLVPFLVHCNCAEERLLAVFDQAWVHSPFGVFGVFSEIHDDLSKAASDSRFLDRAAEAIEAIPISKLDIVRIGYRNVRTMRGNIPCFQGRSLFQSGASLQY